MKQKKLQSILFASALSLSMLTSYGAMPVFAEDTAAETTEAETDAAEDAVDAEAADSDAAADEADNEAAAQKLLEDLTGTYQELWPVILDDQYEQLWLDDCKELVGEDNAQAAYADGNGVYDCHFTEGVDTLEFDGSTSTIKGYDKDGEELFSHTYHYVGMEDIRGLYEFESDDAEVGEFTYFCIAPDTNETTYHIELRYGSDLEKLGQYDAGEYAYWLGSGISTDYDQEMVENCIQLFYTENLSE